MLSTYAYLVVMSLPELPPLLKRTPLHTVSPPDGHRQKCPSGRGRHCPRIACLYVGHCQAHGCDTQGIKTAAGCSQSATRCSRPSEETQPRFGVTLGGVMRPQGTLVPRMRQAPDGCKESGSQPTDISVLNRRVLLTPALPIDKRKNYDADVKKLLPTLDIGSHINASGEPRPIAEAT
jgi:hypothetical protein